MPIELEPDAFQRRADAFMRGRVAQRPADGHEFGVAVVTVCAPQRSSNGEQNSTNERFAHES